MVNKNCYKNLDPNALSNNLRQQWQDFLVTHTRIKWVLGVFVAKNRILETPSMLRALALEGCKNLQLLFQQPIRPNCPTSGGGFLFFIFTNYSHRRKKKYYFNEGRETKRQRDGREERVWWAFLRCWVGLPPTVLSPKYFGQKSQDRSNCNSPWPGMCTNYTPFC